MRIIYLHQFFNTTDMPGSTRSFDIAKRLIKEGHEVFMITAKRDSFQQSRDYYSFENGIHVLWVDVPYSNNMGFIRRILSFSLFSIIAVYKTLSIKADLIIASSTPLTIAAPAIIVKTIKRIPLVFEVRDLWPEVPIALGALKSSFIIAWSKWIAHVTYNMSSKIITLSDGMKKGIIKYGCPERKITVIPNFAHLDLFDKQLVPNVLISEFFNEHSRKIIVVYVGTLGKVNGISYLVEIAHKMFKINSNVIFLISGDGKEKTEIIKLAKKLNVLNKNVFFMNVVSKKNVPYLLSKATITSSFTINNDALWNNSANKFFDSLAAGKPIMINYDGWQKDLIKNETLGIAVSPVNPKQAALKLNKLLKDKEMLKLMSLNARKIAEQEFSSDLLTGKFLNTIQSAYDNQ